MNNHENQVRLVGALNLIWGLMGLLGILVTAFILMFGMFAIDSHSGEAIPFWLAGGLMTLFAGIFLVASAPSIVAGYGLLRRRPWGRVLTIVVSVFNLAAFPLGTALGVYSLIVLLDGSCQRVFDGDQATPGRMPTG